MFRSRALSRAERRILKAFCEAMTPAGGRLPAAERDVEVVAPIADFLAQAPPRVLISVRLALRVFDLAPLLPGLWQGSPRRFHKLDEAARARHLERFDRSQVAPVHALLMLLKTLAMIGYTRDPQVQAALDYSPTCAVREGIDAPRPQLPLDESAIGPPETDVDCDVAVVGSGAGGAVVARTLAEAGLDVVVLEEGAFHDRGSFDQDPLRALPMLYRDCGLTVCEGSPIIPVPVGRCVGGTTLINSGTCFKAPAAVLDRWRSDWGIGWARAADLDPLFEQLERELLVEPVDVTTMGRNGQLCMAGAAALGISGGPIRRYANGCQTCGTCPTGCAIDAKQATHVSYMPRAVAAGARLHSRCRVERVWTESGRLRGLEVTTLDGARRPRRRLSVRAKRVVLSAGALGTPELLLRSGLASCDGQIGRNLHIHPACWVGARYPAQVRGWEGIMQSYYVDEWQDRGLLLEATFTPLTFAGPWVVGTGIEQKRLLEQFGNLGSIGVHLSDRSSGRVTVDRRGHARIRYRLERGDTERLLYGIARAADVHFAAGAVEVYPQVLGLPAILPGDQHRIEARQPRARELHLEAFHPMGTCRMGGSPSAAAVAPSGELYGVRDLYVADASLFPTSLGVNPMLTIMAFAEHIARGIASG